MPTRGLQFPTTIDPGLPDEPPVQLLSQWRQIKNGKAVPQEPPLVDEPAANAWNGFVASLQANQAKQVKQTAKQQCRHKQPKQDGWYGTVYWNDAWDDAMKKETARPPDNPAQAQPQDSAVPDAPRAVDTRLPLAATPGLLRVKVRDNSASHPREPLQAVANTVQPLQGQQAAPSPSSALQLFQGQSGPPSAVQQSQGQFTFSNASSAVQLSWAQPAPPTASITMQQSQGQPDQSSSLGSVTQGQPAGSDATSPVQLSQGQHSPLIAARKKIKRQTAPIVTEFPYKSYAWAATHQVAPD